MKKILLVLSVLVLTFTAGVVGWWIGKDKKKIEIKSPVPLSKPLEKYTFENLSKTQISPGKIKIEENLFSFEFDPTLQNKKTKKVTGQINIPSGKGPFPVVIMLRGYVDKEIYKTGMGTRKAAKYFSENGFITLAPDFLGYGGSDPEAENIFEARFQTYTTVLSLLKSLQSINAWDKENVFLWGHSNGGQIALAILEITGKNYPTTLWAPVSKPFPYSILYYTEELDDKGKYLRRELAKFEKLYDVNLYSIHQYLNRISKAWPSGLSSPIQIHQGTADEFVPLKWSHELVKILEDSGVKVNYFKYPGADHNLVPNWKTVVARDLAFFRKNLARH
jgi:dipeptidyl aminopeptidase/acylaminoacyl peptidase